MQRRALLQGAAAAALAAPALAQSFPDRPIRLVVPYAPGGGTDATMRVLVGPMGEILGQSFVVENRTGGAGSIGAAVVAQARPACDYPQLGRSAISIPSSMSARRESPRQRTMMPGGGSRERPRWPPRRASLRT